MPKLPVISGRDCVRALQKAGFVIDRQRGSHIILIHDNPVRTVSVPNHSPIRRGTLRSIIREAGMTVEEFTALL